ncbi:hypothetical protein Tco_0900394 [Tanacetum coccineum]
MLNILHSSHYKGTQMEIQQNISTAKIDSSSSVYKDGDDVEAVEVKVFEDDEILVLEFGQTLPLGKADASERRITIRALEDIIPGASSIYDRAWDLVDASLRQNRKICKQPSCRYFSLSRPIGIAVGIEILSIYRQDSNTSLIVEETLNSGAAGILSSGT